MILSYRIELNIHKKLFYRKPPNFEISLGVLDSNFVELWTSAGLNGKSVTKTMQRWHSTENVKGLDFVLAKHKPLNP